MRVSASRTSADRDAQHRGSTSRGAWSDCASNRGTARGGERPTQSSREAAIAAKRAAIAQAKADKQAAAKAKAEAEAVPVPTEAELKAARDAKYAARKKRKKGVGLRRAVQVKLRNYRRAAQGRDRQMLWRQHQLLENAALETKEGSDARIGKVSKSHEAFVDPLGGESGLFSFRYFEYPTEM